MSDLVGHGIQLVIAVVAIAALAVSVHAQRRLSRLGSMQFPGVRAVWETVHKAGPRDKLPPLAKDMHEIHLDLTEKKDEFSIAEVLLTRWDDYWAHYRLQSRTTDDHQLIAYIESDGSPLPKFLRVKVERRGGVQAAWWQRVRIEGLPS